MYVLLQNTGKRNHFTYTSFIVKIIKLILNDLIMLYATIEFEQESFLNKTDDILQNCNRNRPSQCMPSFELLLQNLLKKIIPA